jgi:hypothetical protein
MAELPKADRLGFFTRANGVQEFLFEEEHAAKVACLRAAEATSPKYDEAKTGLISTARAL